MHVNKLLVCHIMDVWSTTNLVLTEEKVNFKVRLSVIKLFKVKAEQFH